MKWSWAGIVLGALLCGGPLLGFVDYFLGPLQVIERERAPTPTEMSNGMQSGTKALALGVVTGALGAAILMLSLADLRRAKSAAHEDDETRAEWDS